MIKILILCTGNSCRSQIADGWLTKFLSGKAEIYSAGVNPEKVNPNAVKVMSSVGIDISRNISNHADEYKEIDFDYVITVCDYAKETCPVYSNAKEFIHHSFADPADAKGTDLEVLEIYKKVRDDIKSFLTLFCNNKIGIQIGS